MIENAFIVVGASGGLGRSLIKSLNLFDNACLILIAGSELDLEDLKGAVSTLNSNCRIELYKKDLSNSLNLFSDFKFPLDCQNWEVYLAQGWSDAAKDIVYSQELFQRLVNVNFASNVLFTTECLKYLDSNRRISISVIGSIAIMKSRANNVIYTASKLALQSYVKSVSVALSRRNEFKIQYIVIGFMKTTMNQGSPSALTISPQVAAQSIIQKLRSSKKTIIYIPFYWILFAFLFKIIPSRMLSK